MAKNTEVDKDIERFTTGKDREMDLYLAEFDVLGSAAHARMLEQIGLISPEELPLLLRGLREIYEQIQAGKFTVEEGVEDVHSQVELMLTRKLGDLGKKIHSGRSRNDQVLLDLKLFTRHKLEEVLEAVHALFELLIKLSERYKSNDAGLHAFANSHAFFFRTLVCSLRRIACRRRTGVAGCL